MDSKKIKSTLLIAILIIVVATILYVLWTNFGTSQIKSPASAGTGDAGITVTGDTPPLNFNGLEGLE